MIKAKLIGGDELVARLERLPGGVREALRQALQVASMKLLAKVKRDKLSGQVLNVRTGRLRRSINQRMVEDGSRFAAYVGTNVEYGAAHEYGLRKGLSVREHLRMSKAGKQFSVRAHVRNVDLPARSFLRSALADMKDEIAADITRSVTEAITK